MKGIIIDNADTFVSLGDVCHGSALLGAIGILITSVLVVKKVPGSLLIGILSTAIIGIPMGVTDFYGMLEKLKGGTPKDVKKAKTTTVIEQSAENRHNNFKMSYKDKRLLEVLPVEISSLENRIKEIEEQLTKDVDMYTRSPQQFDSLTAELEELRNTRDEKETLWLELQIKAEELIP